MTAREREITESNWDRVNRLMDNKSPAEIGMAIMNASAEDWLAMRAVLGDDLCDQLAAGVLLQWGRGVVATENAGEISAGHHAETKTSISFLDRLKKLLSF